MLYLLETNVPYKCEDPLTWGTQFRLDEASGKNWIGDVTISDIRISTKFLGVDKAILPGLDPILFETIVWMPNKLIGHIDTYSNWEDAELGHAEIVNAINNEIGLTTAAQEILVNVLAKLND